MSLTPFLGMELYMAKNILPVERIEKSILLIDDQKVLLDYQLAEMYGVPLKAFN